MRMEFFSEKPLDAIDCPCEDMEFYAIGEKAAGRFTGAINEIYRAFDDRIGFEIEADFSGNGDVETVLIPLERITHWRFLEAEDGYDGLIEGDQSALAQLFEDEIKSLMGATFYDVDGNKMTWEDRVADEKMSREAPGYPNWHRNGEMAIYLTLAASTEGDTVEALATRVGGALWAAMRTSNPERVALARDLVGLKVDDDRFWNAAAATDPHQVARVQSAAMFVALGGGTGTPETMRLLTMLQQASPVPRFF
jgi:hypothetical protein